MGTLEEEEPLPCKYLELSRRHILDCRHKQSHSRFDWEDTQQFLYKFH